MGEFQVLEGGDSSPLSGPAERGRKLVTGGLVPARPLLELTENIHERSLQLTETGDESLLQLPKGAMNRRTPK